jgi:hypothetical protein
MFIGAEDALCFDGNMALGYSHYLFFTTFLTGENTDENINNGNAQIFFQNLAAMVPLGIANRNANTKANIKAYHLMHNVQSSKVTPTAHKITKAINNKREGSIHWKSLLQ